MKGCDFEMNCTVKFLMNYEFLLGRQIYMKKIKLIYTSDVHGHILASDYTTKQRASHGLSRLSTYLKSITEPFIYIDNGDILQGSPFVDVSRNMESQNPCASALNLLGARYVTLGNHDFNYGLDYLNSYLASLDATLLCANVLQAGVPLGERFSVQIIDGIRVGFIGLVTAYVPQWEAPDHIEGLTFLSAAQTALEIIQTHRHEVDAVVVLYHGGFETHPVTREPIGRQTIENEAMAIAAIEGVDVVLTGHQHMPTLIQQHPLLIQPAVNGRQFGVVDIEQRASGSFEFKGELIDNTFLVDESFEREFNELEAATQTWLDEPIGKVALDMTVNDPLTLRSTNHPLTAFCHSLQRRVSDAQISVVSFPNQIPGFHQNVTVRDLAATFIYDNTLCELKIRGDQLLLAMEQTATYFEVHNNQLTVSEAFLYPKVEHYNYDLYDGLTYTIDVSKPAGQRISSCMIQGRPLNPDAFYNIVLNNYRANGGGDYEMFQSAELIKNIDTTLFQLAIDAIKSNASFTNHLPLTLQW